MWLQRINLQITRIKASDPPLDIWHLCPLKKKQYYHTLTMTMTMQIDNFFGQSGQNMQQIYTKVMLQYETNLSWPTSVHHVHLLFLFMARQQWKFTFWRERTEEKSVLAMFLLLGDRTIKIVQDAHLLASLVTAREVFYDETKDNIDDADWGRGHEYYGWGWWGFY